jgi:hypothetical protein
MSNLEIINLRIFDQKDLALVELILREVGEWMETIEPAPNSARLYRNSSIENDWAIHLVWSGSEATAKKSALAVFVLEAFRNIGLVHYTVWMTKKDVSA